MLETAWKRIIRNPDPDPDFQQPQLQIHIQRNRGSVLYILVRTFMLDLVLLARFYCYTYYTDII